MTASAGAPGDPGTDPLRGFLDQYDFGLDRFQRDACVALAADRGVLVAAPTGSGKTVVGEYAIHLAIQRGGRCFYTTPIKALSNQKFRDFQTRFGAERVGLLTGDNSINPSAPIIVMTTEILRNMLYADGSDVGDLTHVVMDEVHYLADRARGAVWEEVLIHLPQRVLVTALSATVSNAEEFGAWLASVRGSTDVIVSEHRPVPLSQHVLAPHAIHDLFSDDRSRQINPELLRMATSAQREQQHGRRGRGRSGRGRGRGQRVSRPRMVEQLRRAELLPAIDFVFSRAGCDDAVDQCLRAGVELTTARQRQRILGIVEDACRSLDPGDLAALDYEAWKQALGRGVAAHHAGMVPLFKEVVEKLFTAGLVKVVFATETLALGINMPARCVVIERLVKWNGETHVELTAGEYTQLTGRAGRRGIDVHGHAVVAWSDQLDLRWVAGLARTRTYPLRSSFRPSYNMAVNLSASLGRARATALLETSFAQFQTDAAVVDLAAEITRHSEALRGYEEAMACDRGDFTEYARLRSELSTAQKDGAARRRHGRRQLARESLIALSPGDVVVATRGRRSGPVVILAPAPPHRPDPYAVALDTHHKVRHVRASDIEHHRDRVGRLPIPSTFDDRSARARQHLARQLKDLVLHPPAADSDEQRDPAGEPAALEQLRTRLRHHPCHDCPDREAHARWGERHARLLRRTLDLKRRVARRTSTIARQFHRTCDVLEELGYLAGSGEGVTDAGHILARIYGDNDLVIAEAMRTHDWRDLTAIDLAALTAAFVYESRRDDAPTPRLPRGVVREALVALQETASRLREMEAAHSLRTLPELDLGLCWAMHRWAAGSSLDAVLWESQMTAGDFVRWSRQVIDVLGQIAEAQPDPRVAGRARDAIRLVDRGVVAYSGVHD